MRLQILGGCHPAFLEERPVEGGPATETGFLADGHDGEVGLLLHQLQGMSHAQSVQVIVDIFRMGIFPQEAGQVVLVDMGDGQQIVAAEVGPEEQQLLGQLLLHAQEVRVFRGVFLEGSGGCIRVCIGGLVFGGSFLGGGRNVCEGLVQFFPLGLQFVQLFGKQFVAPFGLAQVPSDDGQ